MYMEGWEAWEVVQRCGSQVRTNFGKIVGFDYVAMFQMCEALGFNKKELFYLFQAAEIGFLEAISKNGEG